MAGNGGAGTGAGVPTRKMGAVAVGGAIATVVTWLIESLASLDVPNTVAVAFGVIFAWLCGYIIKEPAE